jgi:hypothetical protein
MSFNGSGTFVINSTGQPVVTGTVISSTAFNALTADLATGLSTTMTKDGQTTATANIPMGHLSLRDWVQVLLQLIRQLFRKFKVHTVHF